ncbi:hypothetical protein [Sporosarcina sp. YIM B06819]|nr:hypothetical protein [Sporosarcina sp. YIM B06819]
MGLMFTTVIGYAVCLGLAAAFTMHYLSSAFDSSSSVTIDPKPENKF